MADALDPTQMLFPGGGSLGALVRQYDWSKTELGPLSDWPQCLLTAVDLMLNSRLPMFISWGKNRTFLYNDAYAPILGQKHPQALGRTFYENWSEIWDDIFPLIERIDRGENVYFEDLRLVMHRHQNDKLEETYFTFSYSPIRDERNQVAGLFCACSETTLRIRAEAALKAEQSRLKAASVQSERERAKFETAFNAVAEGIFIFDSKGQPVFMNDGAAKVFGAGSAAEVTKDFGYYFERLDLYEMNGEYIPTDEWPVSKALRGQSFRDWQIRAHRRDIDRRWIWSSSGELANQQDSDVDLAVVVLRDITEQKAIEESLRDAVRARDEFLSVASHELKTPLTSLRLQAQLHKRMIEKGDSNAFAPGRVHKTIEQTDKQISRISRLVDDMLDVSRIRSGKLNIVKERFDLCEMVREVLSRLQNQFATAGYAQPELTNCADAVGNWDNIRIEQVLINILTNAIRYGGGKPISVAVGSDRDTVRLCVSDQGIGIEKHMQAKIFDRFERAVSSDEVSGLGLGLFITQQIVHSHGGRIWVESEHGKGASFFVQLPKGPPATGASGKSAAYSDPDGSSYHAE